MCVFFFVLNFAYAQKPFSLIYETPVWHWMSSLNLFDGLLSHRFSQKYIYMRLRAMCNEYQFLFFFSFAICLLNALAAVSSKTYSMLNFNQKQCQINLTVLLWWKRIHYDFFPFRKKLEKEIPPGKIVFLMITRKRLYYIYLMRIFICNSAVSNCRRFCEFAISDNADLSRNNTLSSHLESVFFSQYSLFFLQEINVFTHLHYDSDKWNTFAHIFQIDVLKSKRYFRFISTYIK